MAVDWTGRGRAPATAVRLLGGEETSVSVVSSRDGTAAAAVKAGAGACLAGVARGDLLMAFEGRLHDAASLRRDLGLDAETPAIEMLGRAYERWGDALAEQVRGDYALAIWDAARRRLLAVRDPFGVRPLHHVSRAGLLSIASSVEQLLGAGVAATVPDDRTVVEFLTRDFRARDRSFFRDIARLPPGHRLIATDAGAEASDYRRLPTSALSFSNTEECHEAFREQFTRAVRRRLPDEGSGLIPLSGGVDSTSVICVADQLLAGATRGSKGALGASATHAGLDCDETTFIDSVAAHLRIPVYRWDGTAADQVEFTEPFLGAPGSRLPWSGGTEGHVPIARSHGATIILDGTGGDQVGMPMGVELDQLARPRLWRSLWRELSSSEDPLARLRGVARRAAGAASPGWLRRIHRRLRPPAPPPWLVPQLLSGARAQAAPERRSFRSWGQRLRWQILDGGNQAAVIDMKQRHASSAGLDATFPFLDWDLVGFVLAVPVEHWPAPRWLARLHREALRSLLPPAIYLRQSKADFTSAMANRVRRSLAIISELVSGKTFLAGRFVNQKAAMQLLRAFEADPHPSYASVHAIWAIGSVETWLRAILGYRTSA
ncbi:MAG TPA: asparagine synthase-related protein [Polyangia bacterium]|nr:asparagine synthase-related protein [Polyangia bacterium]